MKTYDLSGTGYTNDAESIDYEPYPVTAHVLDERDSYKPFRMVAFNGGTPHHINRIHVHPGKDDAHVWIVFDLPTHSASIHVETATLKPST